MSIPLQESPALERYRPSQDEGLTLWEQLGIPGGGQALHDALQEGFPYAVFERLAEATGFTPQVLRESLGIPRSTLQRREQAGRFTEAESDRLYRFAEVYQAALALWRGDTEAAQRWLSSPVKGLGFQRPIDMLHTMVGTQQVLDLMGRLRHGVVT